MGRGLKRKWKMVSKRVLFNRTGEICTQYVFSISSILCIVNYYIHSYNYKEKDSLLG